MRGKSRERKCTGIASIVYILYYILITPRAGIILGIRNYNSNYNYNFVFSSNM